MKTLNGFTTMAEKLAEKSRHEILDLHRFTSVKDAELSDKRKALITFLDFSAKNDNGEFRLYIATRSIITREICKWNGTGKFKFNADTITDNDITFAIKYLYETERALYTCILNKNGEISIMSHKYAENFYTVTESKKSEKKNSVHDTHVATDESEGENSNKMDIAIADAIALLKSHGYIVLNKEEYDIVNADVTDESTEVA